MIPTEILFDSSKKLLHPFWNCKRINQNKAAIIDRSEAMAILRDGNSKMCKECFISFEESFNWLKKRTG